MTELALRLAVEPDGLATLTFDLPGRRANIFTRAVLAELEALLDELSQRREVAVLALVSEKIIAGADVEEIAAVTDAKLAEEGSRYGHRLFNRWAALPFPTVAALGATTVGGGTELSLASTWIVLSDRSDLKIGLPEVQLGIVPGWGGSVRLPRRVGLASALDLILTGKTISGRQALAIGLADALLPEAGFRDRALDFARTRGRERRQHARRRGARAWLLESNPIGQRLVLAQARRQVLAKTHGNYPAPLRAIDVVATGLQRGEAAGFDAEARAIGELAVSPVAKNLMHLFQLIEANKRASDGSDGVEIPLPRRPAVIGAGVMGGGIAALFADKLGLPVRIRDVRLEPLSTALAHAQALFEKRLRRRQMKPAELRRKMALLQLGVEESGLAVADFVIEAIVEKLEVKQRLFAELARIVAPTAVLASNTSTLSIGAIAAETDRPERVVGMHFFNPVDRMPLVEVVAGIATAPEVVAATCQLAKSLGKTAIVVRDAPGFLVNRLLAFYSAEAMWLVDAGYPIDGIDRAMLGWGMPMGPFRLADEVGLDVSEGAGRVLQAAFGERLLFPAWFDRLARPDHFGVKSGSGIYRYRDGRQRELDPKIYSRLGLPEPRRDGRDRSAIAQRLLLPMVNEAARCLAEGVVDGPDALDLALVLGSGFPPFRGGLCRWADASGPTELVASLESLASELGPRLLPSPALREIAARGGFYSG